jgi:hypothetical protein
MAITDSKITAAAVAVRADLKSEEEANATVAIPVVVCHRLGQLNQQFHLLFGGIDVLPMPPNTANQSRRPQA